MKNTTQSSDKNTLSREQCLSYICSAGLQVSADAVPDLNLSEIRALAEKAIAKLKKDIDGE